MIELLHPEIAAVSHGNEQKSNAVHESAPIPVGPQDHEEKEGKMYGASLPPPDYEQPVNTNMKTTSDLMESGSSSEADEEQAGMSYSLTHRLQRPAHTSISVILGNIISCFRGESKNIKEYSKLRQHGMHFNIFHIWIILKFTTFIFKE